MTVCIGGCYPNSEVVFIFGLMISVVLGISGHIYENKEYLLFRLQNLKRRLFL